jgi:hypothetical protein
VSSGEATAPDPDEGKTLSFEDYTEGPIKYRFTVSVDPKNVPQNVTKAIKLTYTTTPPPNRVKIEDQKKGFLSLFGIIKTETLHPDEPYSTIETRVGNIIGGKELLKLAVDEYKVVLVADGLALEKMKEIDLDISNGVASKNVKLIPNADKKIEYELYTYANLSVSCKVYWKDDKPPSVKTILVDLDKETDHVEIEKP